MLDCCAGSAVGIVAWTLFTASSVWRAEVKTAVVTRMAKLTCVLKILMPSVSDPLHVGILPSLMRATRGEVAFAFLTALTLLLVTSLITVSWWTVCILMWPVRKLGHIIKGVDQIIESFPILTLTSYQKEIILRRDKQKFRSVNVRYLHIRGDGHPRAGRFLRFLDHPSSDLREVHLSCVRERVHDTVLAIPTRKPAIQYHLRACDSPASLPASPHDAEYVLLFLMWLLPLAAALLAVWIRTLAIAGPTALGNFGRGTTVSCQTPRI